MGLLEKRAQSLQGFRTKGAAGRGSPIQSLGVASPVVEGESILRDRAAPSPLVQKLCPSCCGLLWQNGSTPPRLPSGLLKN